jgi:hypothetical protein
MTTREMQESRIPNGPAAAALLAGGVGAFTVGLMTTLSEASAAIASKLAFYAPVGPLSGKTTISVIVWLIVWGVLGASFKGKELDFGKVSTAAFILLALGILGTFPPFFELFAAE